MEKIVKISVSKGIYWIEIPEVGLRVLCGCPADSVKHLTKRGLIIQKETDGTIFESGPNAILLSDTMLQNGEFSNLAEFPILQMLYKQGMLLPNHPNNTGAKPLLLGLSEQINAQLQYVYRGNYGLISKEEIQQTGIAEAAAIDMMRMKLKFAFGHIKPTTELLDFKIIADQPINITGDVFIRRLAFNEFEFAYKGETANVNLNLVPKEKYESAYPLGFQQIKREYFAIIHSGEGDGWDANRPTMSSILMFQGKIFLIDAGPNLLQNLMALGIGLNEIEGVFHTHAHDDHFAGITTLMRAGRKIKYFAPAIIKATVVKKIATLLSIEEETFEDFFEVHDLKFDTWNDIEGLEVMPLFSPHPVETSIYIFRTLWADGYKSYAHFADIVSLDVLKDMVVESTELPGVSHAFFQRIKTQYLTPTDLKKIDIGGGLIHGVADDFRTDASKKILLSHTSQELTPAEKEIGSSAPHGITDTLISGQSDFSRRNAFQYLQSYFPKAPLHHIRILLNSEVVNFNPGTIILKPGTKPKDVFLILTGMVERIQAQDNILNQLSAGTLLGEMATLRKQMCVATYRTVGFVMALKIPVSLYTDLIKRNGLLPKLQRTWNIRSVLQNTPLFGEGVSHQEISKIFDAVVVKKIQAGSVIAGYDLGMLNIITKGSFKLLVGNETLATLGVRDVFGEEGAIFDFPCLFSVHAIEDSETWQISGEYVKNVPIVRWKLFEAYRKRAMKIIHSGKEPDVFLWRDEYRIQISQMDTQHKKLVEIANSIMEIIRSNNNSVSMQMAINTLVKSAKEHFLQEEAIMAQYGYPELAAHKKKHEVMSSQVVALQTKFANHKSFERLDFKDFFTNWIINHFLQDDRKYASFLNAKHVY